MLKHAKFYKWLLVPFLFTLICGLIYVTLQQNYRQTANDPQIQVAEAVASRLSNGDRALTRSSTVDIAQSQSLFVVVYDKDGKPVGGTGKLGAGLPTIPHGSLSWADRYGENRITWQPLPMVRDAIVIKPYKNANGSGYVLVGRSLKETEKRIDQLSNFTFWAWVVGMIAIGVTFFFERKRFEK